MLVLLDVIGWAIAILIFVGGIVFLIGMFIDSSGWTKFMGVVAAVVGVVVFFVVYSWLDSIGVSLFATGAVLALFGGGKSVTESPTQSAERQYGVGDAVMDTLCEYELAKAAAKEAIRESKENE